MSKVQYLVTLEDGWTAKRKKEYDKLTGRYIDTAIFSEVIDMVPIDLDDMARGVINQGKEDAWELARAFMLNPGDGGLTSNQIREIFGGGTTIYDVFKNHHGLEAELKYKEWREKNKLKVGDIVIYENDFGDTVTAFVTKAEGEEIDILCKGGYTTYKDAQLLRKTGKSIFDDKDFDISKWLEGRTCNG